MKYEADEKLVIELGYGKILIAGGKRSDGKYCMTFSVADKQYKTGEELGSHTGLLPNTFLEIISDKKESFEIISEQCYRAINGKPSEKIFTLSGLDVLNELKNSSSPECYQYIPAHLYKKQQEELEELSTELEEYKLLLEEERLIHSNI